MYRLYDLKTYFQFRNGLPPTWEFGLLAGVAGCSRVATASELIRNNRTLPFSTLCWIRQNTGIERRDYKEGNKNILISVKILHVQLLLETGNN